MKLPLFLLPLSISAQTYTSTWEFPSTPCFAMVQSCADSDVMDCALAVNSHPQMVGTNLSWNGVLVCSREDEVFTKAWTWGYNSQHFLTLAAVVSEPVHVESISIRYRTTWGGPMKLKVDWEPSTQVSVPSIDLGDHQIPDTSSHELIFTNLGDAEEGLFLMIRAHEMMNSSAFYLEGVTITATPRLVMGFGDVIQVKAPKFRYRVDPIGRIF